MNSKQRRKLIRKYRDQIIVLRIDNRVRGGEGLPHWTDYQLAQSLNLSQSPWKEFITGDYL